jgi:putative membrane protein
LSSSSSYLFRGIVRTTYKLIVNIMMYYNNDYFFSPLHFLFTVISWVIVIAVILWVVRRLGRQTHHMHMPGRGIFRDPGMDILRERFAKGEISKEEYEEKRRALMQE